MKKNIDSAKSLEFAAMIFMFGSTVIIATHEDTSVTIQHFAGADGGTDINIERTVDDKEYAILLQELSGHDFIGEYDDSSDSIEVVDDKSYAPVEWYFRAADEDDNDLIYITGNSQNSEEYKYLSSTLSKYYKEFNEVAKMLSLAAGDLI